MSSIGELVKDRQNGLLFSSSSELADQLLVNLLSKYLSLICTGCLVNPFKNKFALWRPILEEGRYAAGLYVNLMHP